MYEGDAEKSRASLLLNIVLWLFIAAASAYGLLAPIDPQLLMRRVVIIGPFIVALIGLVNVSANDGNRPAVYQDRNIGFGEIGEEDIQHLEP